MGMLWTTFSPAFSLPELVSDTSTKRNYAEYFASFQLPLQNGEKHEQCICGKRSASLCLYSYDAWTDKPLIKGLGAIYIRRASSILREQGARRS